MSESLDAIMQRRFGALYRCAHDRPQQLEQLKMAIKCPDPPPAPDGWSPGRWLAAIRTFRRINETPVVDWEE